MKICGMCKQEKNESEFATRNDSQRKVKLQWQCKQCHSNYRKEHYRKNKDKYVSKSNVWNKAKKEEHRKYLINYFKLHPCSDCKESNPIVLEFDHVRGIKFDNVSGMLTHSNKKFQEEIDKCEVVCANCHRIRTAQRSNSFWYRYQQNV